MMLATGLKPVVQHPIDTPVMRTPSVAEFATDAGPAAVTLAGVDTLRTWTVLLTDPGTGRVAHALTLSSEPKVTRRGFDAYVAASWDEDKTAAHLERERRIQQAPANAVHAVEHDDARDIAEHRFTWWVIEA